MNIIAFFKPVAVEFSISSVHVYLFTYKDIYCTLVMPIYLSYFILASYCNSEGGQVKT